MSGQKSQCADAQMSNVYFTPKKKQKKKAAGRAQAQSDVSNVTDQSAAAFMHHEAGGKYHTPTSRCVGGPNITEKSASLQILDDKSNYK